MHRTVCRMGALAAGLLLAAQAKADCSKELSFGTLEYPPYVSWQNGEAHGLDADLLAAVMRQAGCSYSFREVPFKRGLRDVAFGELDGMPNVSITPERARDAYFTLPVRWEVIGAFIRSADTEDRAYKNFGDIVASDARVGYVLGGWHGRDFAAALQNPAFAARVKTADEFLTLFRWLEAGLVDVAVVDTLIGRQLIAHHADLATIESLPLMVNAGALHLMLSRKTVPEQDVATLNRAVEALQAQTAYTDILRAHAPEAMVPILAGKSTEP